MRRYKPATLWLLCMTILLQLGAGARATDEQKFVQVSLVSLIATPDKYDGMLVMVKGIAHLDNKTSMYAIFLTREDKRAGNGLNGIYLVLASSLANVDRFNDNYILVRGLFEAKNKGHLDSFSGSLTNVDLIRPIPLDIK